MKKVRFLRHCTAIFLAAAFALSLTGCGGKIEEAPAQPASSHTTEQNEGFLTSGEDLHQLLPNDDNGFYTLCTTSNMSKKASRLVYYIDYATHQGLPLCSAPNCAHDSPDCTAFQSIEDREHVNRVHILDEDHLFYVQCSSFSEHGSQLFVMNRDGTDRRMLTELKNETDESQLMPVFTDNSSIYFVADLHTSVQKALMRVPISGGEAALLCTFESGAEVLGCEGREVFISTLEPTGTDQVSFRLEAINADTGELRPIPSDWQPENSVGRRIIFNGSRFISFHLYSKEEPFYWYEPSSGEKGILNVQWPESLSVRNSGMPTFRLDPFQEETFAQFIPDKLLFWAPQDPDAASGNFRYVVDLKDGSVTMLSRQYISNGNAIPVSILTLTPEGPLTLIESRTDFGVGIIQGVFTEVPINSARYAVIPWQDFWQGNINFVEITGDFVIE